MQYKLATEFGSFVFLVTGNLARLQVSIRVLGWQSGQLPAQVRRLNTTWSRKLSDSLVTQQPSTSTTKLEEGIVGVDWISNCRP